MQPTWDGTSGATALSEWKLAGSEVPSSNLLIGFANGSLGETSAVLLALGALYLLWRRVIGPAIPLVILGTVAVLSASIHAIAPLRCPSPLFMLGAGGLMLGAVFMATDPVASPMTTRGRLAYGGLIGVLVVVIRVAGGLPEGVMYAILFANAVSPLLDRLWQPRVFGTGPLGGPRGAT
jgi:electron transport complex protein RnfD